MNMLVQAKNIVSVMLVTLLLGTSVLGQDKVEEGQRFVEVGQLARVKSKSGESRFVLLDEKGDVVSSLRPAAGIDLTEYLGDEVGVTARTLVDSETPLLLAESVTTFGRARQVGTDDFDKEVALAGYQEEYVANQILPTPAPIPMASEIAQPITPAITEYPITGAGPIGPASSISPGITIHDPTTNYVPSGGGCGVAGCSSCGGGCGNAACKSCAACPCGLPGRWWIRGESLIWWTKGMDTPPLLVSSPPGTSQRNAGVAGIAGNETLFGGEELFSDSRSGARFRLGKWCDNCNWVGFEVDYLFLGSESDNYSECEIGNGIIGRPFTSTSSDGDGAQLIDFPGLVAGTAHIEAETYLWSINPRLRVNLSCERFPQCNPYDPCDVSGYRLDMLVGYRFLHLEDDLSIREQAMSPSNPTALLPRFDQVTYFDIRDTFSTTNNFHGADIGFLWEGYRGPWSLELIGKVGIGSTSQKVTINGSTSRTTNGNSFTDPGGILALSSNIGTYDRNEFSVIPELDATLGYALSPRTRFLVGYSFMYWSNVVRAGEQIDTTINPDLFPDEEATTDPLRPEFSFVDTGYWAQGLSLGLEYRW